MRYRRRKAALWPSSVSAACLFFLGLICIPRPALPCECLMQISDRVEPAAGSVDIPTNAVILAGHAVIIDARAGDHRDAGLILTDDDGNVFLTSEDHIETYAVTHVFRSVELLRPSTHYTASIGSTEVTDFTTGVESDVEIPPAPILVHFSVGPGSIYACAGIPQSTSSVGEFEVAGDGPYFLLHNLGDGLDRYEDVRFSVLSDSPFIRVDGTGCMSLPRTVFQSTNLSFSTMDAAFNESERTDPILVRGAMPLLCECVSADRQDGIFGPMLLALLGAFRGRARSGSWSRSPQ